MLDLVTHKRKRLSRVSPKSECFIVSYLPVDPNVLPFILEVLIWEGVG